MSVIAQEICAKYPPLQTWDQSTRLTAFSALEPATGRDWRGNVARLVAECPSGDSGGGEVIWKRGGWC